MSAVSKYAPFSGAGCDEPLWFTRYPEHDKLAYKQEFNRVFTQLEQKGTPSVDQMVDIITDLNGRLFEGGFSKVNYHKDAEGTLADPKAEDCPMKADTEGATEKQSTQGFSEHKGSAKDEFGGHTQGGSETAPSGHNAYKPSGQYTDGSTGDTKNCSELPFSCFVDETSQFTLTDRRF